MSVVVAAQKQDCALQTQTPNSNIHDKIAVVKAVLAPLGVLPLGVRHALVVNGGHADLFKFVFVTDDDSVAFQSTAIAGAVAAGRAEGAAGYHRRRQLLWEGGGGGRE